MKRTLMDSLSGLVNRVTGTGTHRDKAMAVEWAFARPSDDQLANLYRSNWMAKKVVNIPIDDMLREGWAWNADAADISKLEEEERRLGLSEKLRKALIHDGIYGGSVIIIGDGSQDVSTPLLAVGKGGIKYLAVMSRGQINRGEVSRDIASDVFGEPEFYTIKDKAGKEIEIHHTRVMVFEANPNFAAVNASSPDSWGDSRLTGVLREIAAAASGITGTGRLMDELAVAYYKIAGLTDILATTGGDEQVSNMLSLFEELKSSINAVAIGESDEVEIITAAFAGLPEALKMLLQAVAAGADIPMTRFLGSSPDGMNATGASDLRNYYDSLSNQRRVVLDSQLAKLDPLLKMSALGKDDPANYRSWNSLWQPTVKEQSEIDGLQVKNISDIAALGVAPDTVIQEVVKTIMSESKGFPGAETAWQEAEERGETSLPNPSIEEAEAANKLQAGIDPSTGRPLTPQKPFLVSSKDATFDDLVDMLYDKYNASQPRHPAGTGKGGQFASNGGGSASIRPLAALVAQGASPDLIESHPELVKVMRNMAGMPDTLHRSADPIEHFRNRVYKDGMGVRDVKNAWEAVSEKHLGEGGKVAKDRTAVILIGPPAAGKSSVGEPLARKMSARIIDSDDVKKLIPEYEGGIGAKAVHEESYVLTNGFMRASMKRGENMVIPKVGNDPEQIGKMIDKLSGAGYKVNVVHTKVDPKEAYRRNVQRYLDQGRIVPPSLVREAATTTGSSFDTLVKSKGKKLHGYAEIDNSQPWGSLPSVVRGAGFAHSLGKGLGW